MDGVVRSRGSPGSLSNRCGRGSAGRASPCQGEGRGFESRRPLQESPGQSASGRGFRRSQQLNSHVAGSSRDRPSCRRLRCDPAGTRPTAEQQPQPGSRRTCEVHPRPLGTFHVGGRRSRWRHRRTVVTAGATGDDETSGDGCEDSSPVLGTDTHRVSDVAAAARPIQSDVRAPLAGPGHVAAGEPGSVRVAAVQEHRADGERCDGVGAEQQGVVHA